MSLVDYPIDHKPSGRARGAPSNPGPLIERRDAARSPTQLHPALSFLSSYGVSPNVLMQASAEAARADVRPERALIANGLVAEDDYYRALARHLGLHFFEDDVALGDDTRFPQAIAAGVAPLCRPFCQRSLAARAGRTPD